MRAVAISGPFMFVSPAITNAASPDLEFLKYVP
jgi:hypothetical protein